MLFPTLSNKTDHFYQQIHRPSVLDQSSNIQQLTSDGKHQVLISNHFTYRFYPLRRYEPIRSELLCSKNITHTNTHTHTCSSSMAPTVLARFTSDYHVKNDKNMFTNQQPNCPCQIYHLADTRAGVEVTTLRPLSHTYTHESRLWKHTRARRNTHVLTQAITHIEVLQRLHTSQHGSPSKRGNQEKRDEMRWDDMK